MGNLPFRPVAASAFADDVDKLFFTLVALTIIFTVLVGGLLIFLTVRYRRGSKVDRSRPVTHNTLLELSWSVGPLILALGVFVWSAKLFAEPFATPKNAREIFVIGKQWMWHLQHSNGVRENNELHIPVGEPVRIVMISQDVIHAFYVPEFRMQRHTEPGRYTSFWFTPTKVGRYHLYCNMYCGTQHSEMGGWVYVMPKADFQKWLASGGARPVATGGASTPTGGLTMAQQGAALFEKYQCNACHGAEAVRAGRGPSLLGIYGKNRQLADGRVVKADDGYLRNVVYYPNEYPLAGWPQGMPSYKNVMTEEEVLQVNAYIKGLGQPGVANVKGLDPNVSTSNSGSPTDGTQSSNVRQGNNAGPATSYGPNSNDGGNVDPNAPAANTDSQQWRYMYGGEMGPRQGGWAF
jgi:cytochrome c oxidase subunit 2